MTFKEFSKWMNDRACDGCWGMNVAMVFIDIHSQVRKEPFWKREKHFQKLCKEYNLIAVIKQLDDMRKAKYGVD